MSSVRERIHSNAVIFVICAVALFTAVFWPHDDPTPPDCTPTSGLSCLRADGMVAVPRSPGGTVALTLADWREGVAEYEEENRPPAPGFGP